MAKLLLVRHGERPEIPQNSVGNEVMLTEKGKSDARRFAQNISGPVIAIQSSPIARCMQTAEIIADVVGLQKECVIVNRDLGDPGFIINDGVQAWTHWQQKGHQRVNEYLISGDGRWSGFEDLNSAVIMFDNKIREHLAMFGEGVHVWVTHDTILATYASRIMPRRLHISQWPKYLDFLSVELTENGFVYDYFNMEPIE